MKKNADIESTFFYHSDFCGNREQSQTCLSYAEMKQRVRSKHLGSASWNKERFGKPFASERAEEARSGIFHITTTYVQHLQYMPYGEPYVDQRHAGATYSERFRFNGKEKDWESSFHYYGARYYWSEVLTGWLSVDPLSDKYPSISPYAYCAWNPVILVDPNGMKFDSASVKFVNMYREDIDRRMNNDPNNINQYKTALGELDALEKSTQVYHINNKRPSAKVGGETGYNMDNSYVEINADIDGGMYNLAHELKHAYQFECGDLSFNLSGGKGVLYDFSDERAAFDRGALFGGLKYSDNDIKGRYRFNSGKSVSIGSIDKSGFLGNNMDAIYRDTFMSPYYENNKQIYRYEGHTFIGRQRAN